jgi:hypothetical protein
MPRSDYQTGPIVVNTAYREHLIDRGLLIPVERRGLHATYVHPDPTLRLRGDEDAFPWSQLRKE